MKKALLRVVSVVLVLCLSLVPVCSSYAADGMNSYPVVHVPGLNTREILLNPGTDSEQAVFPPSEDVIKSTVKGAISSLAKVAVTGNWDAFVDELIPVLDVLFANLGCNPDGTTKDNVGIDWSYPTAADVKDRNRATFYYDWRIDPMEISKQLNDFIDYVLESTGSEYVVIDCHSMGGIVTLSYLQQFGYGKVKSVLYDTTAIYGTSSCGKPLADKVDFKGRAVSGFLSDLFLGDEYEDIMTSVFDVLYTLGVFDGVCGIANTLVSKIKVRAYKECLVPIFATMPGLWSLVPEEDFEAAKEVCFGSTGDTYTALIAKIDNYDTKVRKCAAQLITDSLDYMNIGIFSRYNFYMTPVVSNWDVQSDSVLNTRSSSFGATCAPVKGVLPEDYIKAHATKYLSPDNVIDASTCLFPDYTWFIKDFSHSWGTSKLDDLSNAILHSDEQITVETLEKYPQFMIYSDADDSLVPLIKAKENKPVTLFSAIYEFIKQAIALIINKLSGLTFKK